MKKLSDLIREIEERPATHICIDCNTELKDVYTNCLKGFQCCHICNRLVCCDNFHKEHSVREK